MFAPILLPGVPWLPAPMAEMVPSMPRLPISPTARGSEKARGGCALRLDGRLARGSPTTCCILLMFLLLSTCAPIVPNLSGRVCVYVGVACYYNCVGKGHTWRAEGGTHPEACTKACVGDPNPTHPRPVPAGKCLGGFSFSRKESVARFRTCRSSPGPRRSARPIAFTAERSHLVSGQLHQRLGQAAARPCPPRAAPA